MSIRQPPGWFDKLMWKLFNYLRVDYGFSCGRHWIDIDGKVIAQTPGDDFYLPDEKIAQLGLKVIPGCEKHWIDPDKVSFDVSPTLKQLRERAADQAELERRLKP